MMFDWLGAVCLSGTSRTREASASKRWSTVSLPSTRAALRRRPRTVGSWRSEDHVGGRTDRAGSRGVDDVKDHAGGRADRARSRVVNDVSLASLDCSMKCCSNVIHALLCPRTWKQRYLLCSRFNRAWVAFWVSRLPERT